MGEDVPPTEWLEDLRQRATAIEGFAYLLVKGVAPERAPEHAVRILEQAQALHRLLAPTAPASEGRPEVRPPPAHLERLVRVAVAATAGGSAAEPVLASQRDGPVVPVDADRLAPVLAALLADTSRNGPPDTTVEVDVRGEDGSAVVVLLRPAGDLTPSLIADLYRARAVARAHGGDLSVEQGEWGTRVTLRLPLA